MIERKPRCTKKAANCIEQHQRELECQLLILSGNNILDHGLESIYQRLDSQYTTQW